MDSVKPSQKKSKLARTLAKFLHIRAATGIAPVKGIQKVKSQEMVKDDQKTVRSTKTLSQAFMNTSDDEELQNRMALEALLLKLFSTISSVKAAYAQLQFAQSPYDVDGIQASDGLVVSELKNLSELKQCFLKKQFDFSPEKTMVSAEIQELKSRLKMYEILGKKLESQLRLKDSEITFLREKLEDFNKQNKLVDKRLNQSGQLYVLENVHISGLNPSHFNTFLRHTVKGIRSFVRLIVDEMKSACWDIDMAASSIEPGVVYWRADDKCFAFESFVCREMFDSFQYPNFFLQNESLPPTKQQRKLFFERFLELKSIKAKQFLALNPTSTFAKFCRAKYLQLIHPKMESSLFGNLSQRNIVNSGDFPDTTFFASFAEIAKRIWLLHCLAFSFEPEVSIFQVNKGCRFSEVYMESLSEEAFLSSNNTLESDLQVAFTVVPGFRIGKTVVQCQVYLQQFQTAANP